MIKHIHILGASGSGTTTLGESLSQHIPHQHFDTDNYFWERKFTNIRPPEQRLSFLKRDIDPVTHWILTGSLTGWGDPLIPLFDLVVFLYIPKEIRMDRLRHRELSRYGKEIQINGRIVEDSKKFLQWAEQYDDGGLEIRSKYRHEQWLSNLSCSVVRLIGDMSTKERVHSIVQFIETYNNRVNSE